MSKHTHNASKNSCLSILGLIAILGIGLYFLAGLRTSPISPDPWEASATEKRAWAEKQYQSILYSPLHIPSKSLLPISTRVVSKDDLNLKVDYVSQEAQQTPSKFVNAKFDDIYENLVVSRFSKYVSFQNHEVDLKAYMPLETSQLNNKEKNYLYWKFNRDKSGEYTGLPRVCLMFRDPYRTKTIRNFYIFDSTTRVAIANSSSNFMEVAMLHPSPVTVAVDIVDDFTLSAPLDLSGKSIDLGNCQYRVIAEFNNTTEGDYSSSSSGNQSSFEIGYRANEENELNYRCIIEYSSQITADQSWLEIETSAGDKVKATAEQVKERFTFYKAEIDPTTIKSITVHTRPYYTRYVTELDELPNMYEPNRGVTNLFDIKIPNYYQYKALPNMQLKLGQLTQYYANSYSSQNDTRRIPPHNFGEVTVAEMIKKWESLDPDHHFSVDITNKYYDFDEKYIQTPPPTYGQLFVKWWKSL